MSNYRKTMADALREMYPLTEETQIDEATMSSSQIARLKKAYEPMRDKKISTSNADKLSAMMDKVGKDKEALIQLFKADIPFVSQSAVTKLITKHNMKGADINKLREEVDLDEVDRSSYKDRIKKLTGLLKDAEKEKPLDKEWISALKDHIKKTNADQRRTLGMSEEADLDEGKLGDQWQKGAKSVKSGSFELVRGKSGVHDIMKSGKKIGTFSYDDEGDNFVANMKGERGQLVGNDIDTLISNFKEEVDLDEGLGVAEDIPAMEVGTDRYREYAVGLTPGENAEFAAAQDFKVASMKEALAKVWGLDEKALDKTSKEDYDEEDEELKPVKGSKTMTGGKVAKVDTKPKIG